MQNVQIVTTTTGNISDKNSLSSSESAYKRRYLLEVSSAPVQASRNSRYILTAANLRPFGMKPSLVVDLAGAPRGLTSSLADS